jgi:hypothetical protein
VAKTGGDGWTHAGVRRLSYAANDAVRNDRRCRGDTDLILVIMACSGGSCADAQQLPSVGAYHPLPEL